MHGWEKPLIVGAGGFLGSAARYLVGGWVQQRLGLMFPWGTFAVTVSGSFLLGLFLGLAFLENWDPNWRPFVSLGILGGYTTYSTFAYETTRMLEERSYSAAASYFLGTGIGAVLAAFAGIVIARLLTRGAA